MAAGPRRSVARPTRLKQIPTDEAKQAVLGHIANGLGLDEAMRLVGRTVNTYHDWRKKDPGFKEEAQRLRAALELQDGERQPVPDFPEFCAELGWPMAPHHRRMWDVLNGRQPQDMHGSFRLQWGIPWESDVEPVPGGRLIVNIPPGFAKTTTMSIAFSAWLIHKNPDIRIIIVCRDQSLAIQIVGSVKRILTSPLYREMQVKYAPDGGWKDPDASWTQTQIFVKGRGSGEKDPTMQALGIGGRIYGARADVIILDDAVTGSNVNEYDKQVRWIEQEVESRLDGRGLLAIYGTRLSPIDLYSTLRDVTVLADVDDDDDEALSEVPRWTYFSMPAVLDYGDGNWRNWVSLWPERFPPKRLRSVRTNEAIWALTYQQQDVAEDATFNARAIEASINGQRFAGPMNPGAMGHRPEGMDDLYRIVSVDPAAGGTTAMIVGGLDRVKGKRWIMDGLNQRNMSAQAMKDAIKRFVEQYKAHELIIEMNAFQRFLTQDTDLVQWVRARGCRMTPHHTHNNKTDPDFGVMSMAQLFMTAGEPPKNGGGGSWHKYLDDRALIELPSTAQKAWVSELVNQLVVWQPSGMKQLQKTDLVMALWFFNLACQKLLDRSKNLPTHADNPFLSKDRARDRRVINIQAIREARMAG